MLRDPLPAFTARLQAVWEVSPRSGSDTRAHSNASLAQAVRERGVQVSGVYLGRLRNGADTNPSARLVGALADVFDVPAEYFFAEQVSRVNTLLMLRSEWVQKDRESQSLAKEHRTVVNELRNLLAE